MPPSSAYARSQRCQDTLAPSRETGHPESHSPPFHERIISISTVSELVSTKNHNLPTDVPRLLDTPVDNGWPRNTPIDNANTANHASPVNAMGSTSYVSSRGASPSNEFYGGSSAAYFMHQVKETIPRPSSRNHHDRPSRLKPNRVKISSPGVGSYDISGSMLPRKPLTSNS